MTTSETLAAKVAVLKWIGDVQGWLEQEAKFELADEMKPGDRQIALLAGNNIATISMRSASQVFRATDEDRFADWVTERWPDQAVVRVRPEFLEQLKKRTRKLGALIDDDGGVCPWADLHIGQPVVSASIDRELISAIIQELLCKGHTIDRIIRELSEGTTR